MNHQPHDHRDQQQADSPQREDHLKFGHVISFSGSRGGEAAGVQRGPAAFFSIPESASTASLRLEAAGVLPTMAQAAFSTACADTRPADAATSAGALPPKVAATLSLELDELSRASVGAFMGLPAREFLTVIDPGSCGIDFDDDREFDFSKIPARPRLRLVISNSSPVKA